MNTPDFYKAFYEAYRTDTSDAAKLVVVDKVGNNEAARRLKVDQGSVSKMVNRITKKTPHGGAG